MSSRVRLIYEKVPIGANSLNPIQARVGDFFDFFNSNQIIDFFDLIDFFYLNRFFCFFQKVNKTPMKIGVKLIIL